MTKRHNYFLFSLFFMLFMPKFAVLFRRIDNYISKKNKCL
jgi:hypothetical protein